MGSSKSKFVELSKNYNKKEEIKNKIRKTKDNKKISNKRIKSNKKSDQLNHISEEKIEEFIETVLKDQNINIDYLPDIVEKQIYKNVLILMFNLMDKTFGQTSVKFIGHEIKLVIEPLK